MIKIGETHSGRKIVNIEGIWVKYRYSFGEGECTIDTFERRWVLPQAIKATESPSIEDAAAVEPFKEVTP